MSCLVAGTGIAALQGQHAHTLWQRSRRDKDESHNVYAIGPESSYEVPIRRQVWGGQFGMRSSRYLSTWSTAMRSCAMVSRSRMVTVSVSNVSKSTVMQ